MRAMRPHPTDDARDDGLIRPFTMLRTGGGPIEVLAWVEDFHLMIKTSLESGTRADVERFYLGTVRGIRLEPGASVHTLIVDVGDSALRLRAPESAMRGFVAELSRVLDPLSDVPMARGRPPTPQPPNWKPGRR